LRRLVDTAKLRWRIERDNVQNLSHFQD
jgi:hypothetical protein